MMIEKSSQNAEFTGKDLLIGGWINLNPTEGLLIEIESTMWRN